MINPSTKPNPNPPAAAVANRDAYVIDTLACCLYAVGLKDEAIEALRRCIELEPANLKWKDRLREFGG